jgi:DNA-binding CsgD family transcriptional regulator
MRVPDSAPDFADPTVAGLGPAARQHVRGHHAPLLDRDEELAALGALAAAARAGQGTVVRLEGPAGIGRTALLDRLAADLQAAGTRVLRATGSRYEREFHFGIVRQLLEPVVAAAAGSQRTWLLARGGRHALPAIDPDAIGGAGGEDVPFAVLHGLFWLLRNLSWLAPVALLVDDAWWADDPSLRWFGYLATRLCDLPALVVLARRTGEAPDGASTDSETWIEIAVATGHTVRPQPLSRDSVTAIAARALAGSRGRDVGGDPGGEPGGHPADHAECAGRAAGTPGAAGHRSRGGSPDSGTAGNPGGAADAVFGAACHRVTGGNPLLLAQLLEELARHGVRPVAAEVAALNWYAGQVLPEQLRRRLRALPTPCRRLARALAVLGDGTDLPTLARLAGLDAAAAREAAHPLTEAGLVRDRPVLAFTPGLVREAALAAMSPDERAEADAAAARLLFDAGAEVERVASHLRGTEPGGPEGLKGWGGPCVSAWHVVQLRQAAAEALLGEAPAAAGPPYARAASVRAEAMVREGQPAAACRVLERAEEALRGPDPESAWYLATTRLVVASHHPDTWTAAARTGWIAEPEPGGDTGGERAMLAVRAFLHAARGDTTDAALLATRALRTGAVADPVFPTVPTAAVALLYIDRVDEAIGWLEQLAAVPGAPLSQRMGIIACLTEAYLRRGDLGRATVQAESGMELGPMLGWRSHLPTLVARLADAYLQQDRPERATEVVARHPDRPTDYFWSLAQPLVSRGRRRIVQGRPAEGVADLLAAGRRLAVHGWDNPSVANWRSLAALGHQALGSHGEARRLAYEELDLARAAGRQRTLGVSLRVAGAVTPGAEGLRLLREAVDTLVESPARLELAHALVDLGTAEHAAGAATRARGALRQGVELAERCGALPLARRGHEELRRAGGRPRGGYLVGVRALTAAERRVALLARQGHTNRKIAAELRVGVRTVEIHLTNTYRKLGIDSRDDLRDALG